MVGPGKPIDTTRHFVICSNVLGGCQGSTGPGSINPQTGKAYKLDFPKLTVQDMVKARVLLIDDFGIDRLHAVIGGSMGGMQTLQWAIDFPERLGRYIALAWVRVILRKPLLLTTLVAKPLFPTCMEAGRL